MAALLGYDFPGNVRELSNMLERALILAEPGERIGFAHLPALQEPSADPSGDGFLADSVLEFERKVIAATLVQCDGNKTHAAERLGLSWRGLHKKIQRLGMVRADDPDAADADTGDE
jgi:DNA-binding NtrC family response regulator